jgi:hypothetical protein
MNNIDLDLNNYNFNELIYLFNITECNDIKNNTNKMLKKMNLVKTKCNDIVYMFYYKCYKIISFIYELYEKNIILNLHDLDNITSYKNKIANIESFEKYDNSEIINQFLEIKTTNNQNVKYTVLDDLDANKPLNDPNYNIGGNVYPILNNKNNTNTINNVYSNKVTAGDLNSIKRIVQLQNLNLNSCFRDNYFSSNSCNFTFTIPSEVKNVISLRLASIEIPNAWYLFSSKKKNNSFKIEVNENNVLNTFVITIPDGNYDNDTLQYYLNNTYFSDAGIDNPLKYIKFTIDTINFKSKFEIIDGHPFIYNFALIFLNDLNENLMNTAGWILGFRMPSYLHIYDTLTSESLFDGCGDRYIYFSLTDYQYNNNNSNIVCFDKSLIESDILAKIPLTNGKLSVIIDDNKNPLTKTRIYNGPVNINKLHIKILDKFGEMIDLNNMDFSFTLEVELLYESFNFKDISS